MKTFTRAALLADALCLGPHWVYNQGKLARLYSDGVFALTDPASPYHPNRKAGQQTHYGDQALLLARSIARHEAFDAQAWRADWIAGMAGYDGYIDSATQATLDADGLLPSDSKELAGASRLGPLLDMGRDLDTTVDAARQQTTLTHGDPTVADAAEFFVRAVSAVQGGRVIAEAFAEARDTGNYASLDVGTHLSNALAADAADVNAVAADMGLTCHVPEAFPLTLYFALRPSAELRETLSLNALAGGDSSARAMLLALLFAARNDAAADAYAEELGFEAGGASAAFAAGANPVQIESGDQMLAGVLEMPAGDVRATALFAHCFTCGKDFAPTTRSSRWPTRARSTARYSTRSPSSPSHRPTTC